MAEKEQEKPWWVYIVRCRDESLYTGITNDLEARLRAHNAGRGAAYTRSRLPVRLYHEETGFTRSQALSREAEIKAMTRAQKRALVRG